MTNRIRQLEIRDHSLVSAVAEVHARVWAEGRTPATEIRGRLTGPRCPYASTVEVAYPWRLLPSSGEDFLAARAIIPEASFWDPQCPFLYHGSVELWQDGRPCDQTPVRHGLCRVSLGPRGLRWNGHPLTLHGRSVTEGTDEQARAWRAGGYNLLLAPAEAAPLWDRADRLGLVMLGRVRHLDEALLADLTIRQTQACSLGWLVGPDQADGPLLDSLLRQPGLRVGVELHTPPPAPLPEGVQFVACPADAVAALAGVGLPLLVLGRVGEETTSPPLLGWVEDPVGE